MRPSITTENTKPVYPKLFWPALLVGWAFIANGVRGLLENRQVAPISGFGRIFVGAAVVHDLLLAPFVLAVGTLVARLVPRAIRPAVQAGLIISGSVVLFAFPFVRGYGRVPDNPTILPRNYAQGLVLVLAVVWLAVASLAVVGWRRALRRDDR